VFFGKKAAFMSAFLRFRYLPTTESRYVYRVVLALDNGLASPPYNHHFNKWKSTVEWPKKNKAERILSALSTIHPKKGEK